MIPLKDNMRRRRFPLVNICLIIANVAVFLYQVSLPSREMQAFIFHYGLIPREQLQVLLSFLGDPQLNLETGGMLFLPLFTATFLHGGWFHLLSNMIYLWVFGDNIEDRLGHLGHLVVYLLLGAGANLAHVLSAPLSPVPLIGASGAVAGLLGAYFILYPRARILTLVPLGFFITFVYIPAFMFLALWFLLQVFNVMAEPPGAQSVAWWAHIGGFVLGIVVGTLLKPKKQTRSNFE